MRCEFCDFPVYRIRTRSGRSFIPDYCKACKKLYDDELGFGWQNEQWHRETVAMHRRLMKLEVNEAGAIRLDAEDTPELSTEDVVESPSASETVYKMSVAIAEVLAEQPDLGWRRVHKAVLARGVFVGGGQVKAKMRSMKRRLELG